MYSEIKSGAACNTLVTEYILRKKPRGDAIIDTEESSFLRDNLPSLAERRRGRRGQATAAGAAASAAAGALSETTAPAEKGTTRSTLPLKPDVATSAKAAAVPAVATVAAATGDGSELPDTVGMDSTKDRNAAEGRFDADGYVNSAQETAGEARHPQPRGGSRSRRRSSVKYGASSDNGGRNDTRLLRRPSYKVPVNSGLPGSNSSSGTAHNSGRSRTTTKSGETTGEIKSGERRRQIMTSASLKTLSLREMEEREDGSGSRGHGDDALDR